MKRVQSKQESAELPQYTWRELLRQYKIELESANRSPKTISRYMYTLDRFTGFLESITSSKLICQLGRKEVIAYIRYLQHLTRWANRARNNQDPGKLSPYTIQGHVRDLKAFWSWLARDHYVEQDAMAGFPLPKVPQYEIRTLTRDHVQRLVSSIDRSTAMGARYYCMLVLLLDTGVRISELVRIKVNDLDMTQGLLIVLGKGQKERTVPLSGLTRRHLLRYIGNFRQHLFRGDSPYLFPTSDGQHISVNSVQQYLRRLAQKAGIDSIKVSPHVFRHTFATQSIANGANVFAIKDIMGHASLQTTMKYTHLQLEDIKAQHNKFSPVERLFNTSPD